MVGLLDGQSRRENTSHCRGIKITLGSSIAKPLDLRNVGGGDLGGNPWSWLSARVKHLMCCARILLTAFKQWSQAGTVSHHHHQSQAWLSYPNPCQGLPKTGSCVWRKRPDDHLPRLRNRHSSAMNNAWKHSVHAGGGCSIHHWEGLDTTTEQSSSASVTQV